jgi:cell division protein FtsZ
MMFTGDHSSANPTVKRPLSIKVFGVGGAGGNAVEQMALSGFTDASFVVLNTDAQALASCTVPERIQLGAKLTRGLGAGGDPEVGRSAADADLPRLRALCEGVDMVFIATGLGGGTGTGASPVLARVAKEAGALVLGIATLPFDFEGERRQRQAQQGLETFKSEADGVICLPNQKVFKIIDENTSMVETFRITNELLAQGVRSIWRLLSQTGMINIDFADLCTVVRGRHAESSFAAVEAMGPNRAREAVEKLMANPLLDAGQTLAEADTVLVSLVGGPDLTMAEVNRVMEQINRQCENAHIKMGAAIEESQGERLTVTLVASRRNGRPASSITQAGVTEASLSPTDTQFLSAERAPRPLSRFVPPPPALTQEKAEQLLSQQSPASARQRRKASKLMQGCLPLEVVSKGRFEKSEPTIHRGEDLDVPTYIRRGVALN